MNEIFIRDPTSTDRLVACCENCRYSGRGEPIFRGGFAHFSFELWPVPHGRWPPMVRPVNPEQSPVLPGSFHLMPAWQYA